MKSLENESLQFKWNDVRVRVCLHETRIETLADLKFQTGLSFSQICKFASRLHVDFKPV